MRLFLTFFLFMIVFVALVGSVISGNGYVKILWGLVFFVSGVLFLVSACFSELLVLKRRFFK